MNYFGFFIRNLVFGYIFNWRTNRINDCLLFNLYFAVNTILLSERVASSWLSWLAAHSWKRQTRVQTLRESFAFALWCWVQDVARCFLGSRGGASSIRDRHPTPEWRVKRSPLPAHERSTREGKQNSRGKAWVVRTTLWLPARQGIPDK